MGIWQVGDDVGIEDMEASAGILSNRSKQSRLLSKSNMAFLLVKLVLHKGKRRKTVILVRFSYRPPNKNATIARGFAGSARPAALLDAGKQCADTLPHSVSRPLNGRPSLDPGLISKHAALGRVPSCQGLCADVH